MGIPGIAIQPVDEGNSESAVRFLIEWVSDGEAEARRYLTIFNSGGYWVWSSGVWWVMPEA